MLGRKVKKYAVYARRGELQQAAGFASSSREDSELLAILQYVHGLLRDVNAQMGDDDRGWERYQPDGEARAARATPMA